MKNTIITTATLYESRDLLRFRLACKLVEAAIHHGYTLAIVDGSPIPEIAETFRELGAMVFNQMHEGMGASRREAFFHAYQIALEQGCDFILWTDPEKNIADWVGRIIEKLAKHEADIVIPARSEAAWDTWPNFQRESEQEANREYNNIFGVEGFDPMFGLIAFRTEMSKYFALCQPAMFKQLNTRDKSDLNASDTNTIPDTYIVHYAGIYARLAGAIVATEPIDLEYPREQRDEEEGPLKNDMRKKRKWQFDTLVSAYKAIASAMH